jgi:L-methionine (R)-S-oxide reductase
MPETFTVLNNSSKSEIYINLLPQIESLIGEESNIYTNLANVSAAIKMTFNHHWIGFYLIDKNNDQQLVLGPFQVTNF